MRIVNRFGRKLIYFLQGLFLKKDLKCPFCKSLNFGIVYKKFRVIDICHCHNCSLYWTNPIFNFWKFYKFFYRGEGLTTDIDKKKLPDLLKSSFKDSDKNCHNIIKWLKEISSGQDLLEFGSSWGYFLYQANTYGFKTTGVEISEKRAEFGRKYLHVNIISNIDNLLKKREKFNLIFSAHTLEHLGYNIRNIFTKFLKLLEKNGLLVIEVPHFNLSRDKEAFRIMGAVHPLGFVKEFCIKNLSKYGKVWF